MRANCDSGRCCGGVGESLIALDWTGLGWAGFFWGIMGCFSGWVNLDVQLCCFYPCGCS